MMGEYEFHICEYYVPALINDDRTYLTDEEEQLLDAFLEQNPHYYAIVYEKEWPEQPVQFFGKCEVCKKLAWVYELTNA